MWRALDHETVADDAPLVEAAMVCLQESGSCEAARLLYARLRGKSPSVRCCSAAINACAQLSEWSQVLQIFDSLSEDNKIACNNVQTVALAALETGGHAAVCELFFQHFSNCWLGLREETLVHFLSSLHYQNHSKEVAALLSHLQSKRATAPQALRSSIPILAAQEQWKDIIDSYFIIKGSGLSISPQIFSCVIKACAEEAVEFATFLAILEHARLANPDMPACDWNNAVIAASHTASSTEMHALVREAHDAGQTLSAAATVALLLTTNQRSGAADVVKLLKFLPLPLPKQCIAAAAAALVHEDLWQDALAVLESSSDALSLQLPDSHDFCIVERCSKLFAMHGMPTDASFTKAALRHRCIHHLSIDDSIAAAELIMPALRSRLVDVDSCVQVILALTRDAEAMDSRNHGGRPGTIAGGLLQQQLRAKEAAEKAALLRQHAISIFELAGQAFEATELGKALDCIIACLHHQQQPQALIDTLDTYLNTGQKLCDRSYAAAVLANETLGMHERALALLNEIQNRDLQISALRAGSRCTCSLCQVVVILWLRRQNRDCCDGDHGSGGGGDDDDRNRVSLCSNAGAMSCGQRRLALELHAESMEAEQRLSPENIDGGAVDSIPPAVTPPILPHSPGKLNRHASFFPTSSTSR